MQQTIMLLEDDLQLSDTIKAFLSRKGYDVISVYDGTQAEEIIYEKHIDLMLLDVKVPGQDGFTLLQKLRNAGGEIPAIFITSLNSVEDVEKGFGLGCDDYIRKPFALKELLVRVESLLRRSYGSHDEKIELGDELVFDLKTYQLYRNDRHVALKNKECKLLALFLRHSDKLLEYETIYDALWEYGEAPSAGSLRTYIKTLRQVLGKERIETVKNIGYRFVKQ
jgi:DNA-binding response OmpR family regulator